MGICNNLLVSWKLLVVLSLRLLFLVPAGVLVRSGDSPYHRVMDNLTCKQGEAVLLSCALDSKVTHTAWLNRSSILYAGRDKWSLDPRVTLQSYTQKEYTIKIQNVNVYDEGLYTCAVQTNHFPRTTFIHVIVQVPPKIRSISSNISVSEGDNVTLKCLASGKPEPEVTWKHLSAIALDAVSEGEFLEITSITRHDSGLYECKAVNDAASVAQRVEVTVNFPPYISDTKNEGVPLGYKGTLHCEAVAMPIAKFEWYRDQRRILNKLNGVQIQNIGRVSMLTLFNVSEEDYGNYTCVAINKLGSANASIVLYDPVAVQDGKNGAPGGRASAGLLMTLCMQLLLTF
ncbi:neurotrimin-like isoform X2 [Erpetoichthys calabaricus]|uniref:neurotrimin-like isoform X2 n=1 Tax=Erpetoichthys calabaricus TaxID=27687 RepID=UPI002234A039|nr:neurotrimin-like isoform X2 [Erpetoichthys calabaricus]